MRHLPGVALSCAMLSVMIGHAHAQQARPFHLQEATIASIHDAFAAHQLTCTRLTRLYLDRIEAYNLRGPSLHAIITVNPKVMERAAELDRQYTANPSAAGPLHCIPVILKDNFNTADMPTTGGNVAMKTSRPPTDAFVADRIRKAGALILAKANLQEFARGGMSISSLGGQVRNPYDLSRTPGGSSGGTGASIAANFAVLGTGSDTGQSIRSPASANNLVGIRPTRGLVSRRGVIPNSLTQDEVGPIARTVTDAALLLDVMAGYDSGDPITAFGKGHMPKSYTQLLNKDALKGARIGVMRNLFGAAERHREVNAAMEAAIARMESLGAKIIRFDLAEYDALLPAMDTQPYEARAAMERYFAALGPGAPVKTFADLVATKTSAVQKTLEMEIAITDGMNNPTYKDRMLNRDKLRLAVSKTMADLNLDAILYPLQRVLVAPIGAADQAERNGVLSNGTGFPAVTFQAGFSAPTASAPLGVPVGGELLGPDFSEGRLFSYAYALEQANPPRKAPASTPALPNEP
ncbi:MAG TPA: amidase family protein [Micropepsaceae bacterium]|nr:amidase family protein [Micropepsaceae bacterium]